MLTKLTITGPDDKVPVITLRDLSKEYPFVEWGLLHSRKQVGTERYPSLEWIYQMGQMSKYTREVSLSCHICGSYVKDLKKGLPDAFNDIWNALIWIDRFQINTGEMSRSEAVLMMRVLTLYTSKQFIFQHNSDTARMRDLAYGTQVDVAMLVDGSGGRGIKPDSWPMPLVGTFTGYAGGLGPDNLEAELEKIDMLCAGVNYWVDMETGVRDLDNQFDLDKVVQCLEIAKKYVRQ